MDRVEQTITVRSGDITRQTATLSKAEINVIAFNIDEIAKHSPDLAIEVYELRDKVTRLHSRKARSLAKFRDRGSLLK